MSNPLCHRPEVLILSRERPQRVNLLLRHDQHMAITRWIDIEEGYSVLVLITVWLGISPLIILVKIESCMTLVYAKVGQELKGYPLRGIFVRHHICYNESRPRGEVQEWLNWPLSKSGKPQRLRGFESLSLRHISDTGNLQAEDACRFFLLRKTMCLLYFCSFANSVKSNESAHRDGVRICLCEKRAKYYWLGWLKHQCCCCWSWY